MAMPGVIRLLRGSSDRLLTVGAFLGALIGLAIIVGALIGLRPVFLTSGSMAPSMPTGTLALVREVPATSLEVGDVVCVENAAGLRVTHRVASIERVNDVSLLRLRGDANRSLDPETYSVRTADRVVAHVPLLGFLFGWLATPSGLLLAGALTTALVILIVRGDGKSPNTSAGKRRATPTTAFVVATVFVVAGPGQVDLARAAPWVDPVTVSGSTYAAATIASPATFTCGSLGLLSVQFTWAAVAGATNYTLHYGAGGASTATVAGTSATLTSAISGGTAWVVANRNFGSTTWSSLPSTTRTYTVAVLSLCS